MSNMIRNVIDRMMEDPSSVAHAAFLAGGAAASLSFGQQLTEAIPYMSDGLYCLFSRMPETSPVNTLDWFLGGAANYTASVGVGLEAEAKFQGVELTHQTREMLGEMRSWLGDQADNAEQIFKASIAKTKAFGAYAISTGKNFFESDAGSAVKWIGGALIGLAGTWDSIKLMGKIYRRVFKKAGVEADPADTTGAVRADQPTNITNIQINLALSGDQAERILDGKTDARLVQGIQQAIEAATANPAARQVDQLGFDPQKIDMSRYFMPTTSPEGLGPIATASRAFSDQLRGYAADELVVKGFDTDQPIMSGMFKPAKANIDDILLQRMEREDLRQIVFRHRPLDEAAPKRRAEPEDDQDNISPIS